MGGIILRSTKMKNFPAFEGWFKREYAGRPKDGARYLFHIIQLPGDEIASHYLAETGEKNWTADTFLKASKNILEKK
jgi:hypothetical protein